MSHYSYNLELNNNVVNNEQLNLLKFIHFTEEMLTPIRRLSLDGFWHQIHSVIICTKQVKNITIKS